MDLKWLNELVQGHTCKLRSKFGSWTREFWPAWLEKNNCCVCCCFSFLHPCLYMQWITRSQNSFMLGVGWVKKWSAWGILCHCQLLGKISCFLSELGTTLIVYTKLFAPLFSVFVPMPFPEDKNIRTWFFSVEGI